MPATALTSNEQLLQRLSQLLYRCLEEVGSTKAALYRVDPGSQAFELVCHYGWPRSLPPPRSLDPGSPLIFLIHRQKRCFVLNDGAAYPELQAFGQGKADPRYLISPIYDHGEWIALLVQRDLTRDAPYSLERHLAPTQSICEEIVQALKFHAAGAEPQPEAPQPWVAPALAREPEPIRVPAPPTFPEQRSFFWEAAALLCRTVPASAVALWIHHPTERLPVLAYSPLPLSPQLEQQVLEHTLVQRPKLAGAQLQLLTKAEAFDRVPIQGPFRTLLPILMEEQFGEPDLLMVFREQDLPFETRDQETIANIGRMVGLYLEEGRLHERYHQSFLSVSHRILATAGERVPYIRAQSVNTAELARSLARSLDLPSPEVEAVTISAILHDVGTLLLDRRILDKPTLTAEDREMVQTHPILASTFLKDFHFPFDVLRIIRHHHEQWDGKGYPDGIEGEAIPIESRIIHLVESFQVMTSGSAYRAPRPMSAALEELRQLSGTHFDPQLVTSFIRLIESRNGTQEPGKGGAGPGKL